MPAFAPAYSDAERAALANYVLAQWGGLTPKLTAIDARAATLP
jgi:mono/diheme cytochrome c family protein